MDFYERIETLRKKKKISQKNLELELGFSNGSISKWKNSRPTTERLQKIADYFGVSLEYLTTGQEKEKKELPAMSDREQKLLNSFSALADDMQDSILDLIEAAARSARKKS